MIVKNEEKLLKRCLDSIYDLMDEIVIVDTGSTDRTKEIAAKYTDKIYDFEWVNDFSAARNFAFSKAGCDYIYTADADEELDEENRQRFQVLKENLDEQIEIVQMMYCNELVDGSVYNYEKELRPKLYKRLRNLVWIDPVHEIVRTSPVVFDSDIEILHRPQSLHTDRDLEIFERLIEKAEAEKNNGVLQENSLDGEMRNAASYMSVRLLSMYEKELYKSDNIEHFKKAIPYFVSLSEESWDEEEELLCIYSILVKGYRLLGDVTGMFQYAIKAIAMGGCSEIAYELGLYFEAIGNNEEANMWFYNASKELLPLLDIRTTGAG